MQLRPSRGACLFAALALFLLVPGGGAARADSNALVADLSRGGALLAPSGDAPAGSLVLKTNGATLLTAAAHFTLSLPPSGAPVPIAAPFTASGDGFSQSLVVPGTGVAADIHYRVSGHFVEIRGTLATSGAEDRGLVLSLGLPGGGAGLLWRPGPDTAISFDSAAADPAEALWYPLTVLSGAGGAIALAVPATDPAVVSFRRAAGELVMEFRLGTSPLTSPAPNTASFTLLLWAVETAGGFRQALSDSYARDPDLYTRRNTRTGLWTTAVPEGLRLTAPFLFHEHGNVWFSLSDSSARALGEMVPQDAAQGWLTLPYLIAGQMSRVNLTDLPADESAVDSYLSTQSVAYPPQQLRQYVDLGLAPSDYAASLAASRVEYADGTPRAVIRNTETYAYDPETGALVHTWTTIGNQVSFVMDASPTLVIGGTPGHGARMLQWVELLLQEYPDVGGVYLDSLASWSRFADYRRAHFAFTRHPLACDDAGVVYLPNAWGFLDFLGELRNILHARGKLLMTNGVGLRPEGFFLTALVDIVGMESLPGVDIGRLFVRAAAGPKSLLLLKAYLGDLDQAGVAHNTRSPLALGGLPSTWGIYFALPGWVNADESYASWGGKPNYTRDAALWQEVFDLAGPVGGAVWRPETKAWAVSGVGIERFSWGAGDILTLYRAADGAASEVAVRLDAALRGRGLPRARLLPSGASLRVERTPEGFVIPVPLAGGPDALSVVSVDAVGASPAPPVSPILLDAP